MKDYSFQVETIEAGQRKSYGDSFYAYKVTSSQPKYVVEAFCTNVLKRSYKKEDMPSPFDGELLEFKTLNDLAGSSKGIVTYSYKVRTEYTG